MFNRLYIKIKKWLVKRQLKNKQNQWVNIYDYYKDEIDKLK